MGSYSHAFQLLGNPITLISLLAGILIIGGYILWHFLRNKSRRQNNSRIAEITELEAELNLAGSSAKTSSKPSDLESPNKEFKKAKTFPAMVFTDDGIMFKNIPTKLASLVYCEPTMPKSGMKYLAVQRDDTYESFDPREAPIVSDETPQRAWRATHVYELVRAVWSVPIGFLEKLNMIFFWVFCGLLFLALIEVISKIGGK